MGANFMDLWQRCWLFFVSSGSGIDKKQQKEEKLMTFADRQLNH
jgi:hypothetical protein